MHSLEALLSPQSIAVVGASEGPRHGGEVMRSLLASGFSGRVIPVNPRHETIYGKACVATLSDLDEPVDCVVLAVRRDETVKQLALAGEAGARAAVIVAGGFSEAGPEGAALEAKLAETARNFGIRLLGPNTIGFINLHQKVGCYAAAIPVGLAPGNIAVVVQSGTVAGALGGAGRALRLSHVVATGNEVDVGIAELLDYFVDDPQTREILLFIESLRDTEAFRKAAERARSAKKPVVVLRAGNSAAGRRVTNAHTGALADDPRTFSAFARKCGLIIVHSLNELIVTGELLASLAERPNLDGGLAIMTHSGGEAAIFVDIAATLGLTLPPLAEETCERLRKTLPAYHTPSNPLDITGLGATDRNVFRVCLEALCDDPGLAIVAVMQDFRAGHWVLRQAAEVTAEVANRTGKPVVFFSNTTRFVDPEMDELLAAAGVPVLYGTREVVVAIAGALSAGSPEVGDAPAALAVPDEEIAAAAHRALTEGWAGGLISLAGVSAVETRLEPGVPEASKAAHDMGFPVVVKAMRAGLDHKSDAGAVKLGIRDCEALKEALAAVTRAVPDAEALMVQRMAEGAVAELIVGVHRDPIYGWLVIAGAGGTMTELLDDVAVRMAPVSEAEALSMLHQLRLFPILDGFRGRSHGDVRAVTATIMGLSCLAPRLEGLLSAVEINPLMVMPRGEGAIALDTLAIAAGETQ